MINSNDVARLIVECLKEDPEALPLLNSALVAGMQEAAKESQRKSMVYYDGMIAALSLTDKGKLPDDLKILMSRRVMAACEQRSCGYEKKVYEKHAGIIKDIEDNQKD